MSSTAMNPKTTIHVSNIPEDKAKLYKNFKTLEGFKRVSFHQDFCFVCFEDVHTARQAIDYVQKATCMVASYAKHGLSYPSSPPALQPNNVLYLSLSPYFTEKHFLNFLNEFEGFESCKFFPTFALARFDTTYHASNALDLIHYETNFTVNYSKPKSVSVSNEDSESLCSLSRPTNSFTSQPKKTIYVTNIDRDKSALLKMFMYLEGFDRLAFFNDYVFVCFEMIDHAIFAIEEIVKTTKMKASFAKADFIHHSVVPSQIGHPNIILRVSDFPGNMTHSDLIGIFSILEGYSHVSNFYVNSCLVHFQTLEFSKNALEWLNHSTNLTAIYSNKGMIPLQEAKKTSKTKPMDLPAMIPPLSFSTDANKKRQNTDDKGDLSKEKEDPFSGTAPTLRNQYSDASINTVVDAGSQYTFGAYLTPAELPNRLSLDLLYRQYQDAKSLLDSMFSRLAYLEKENESLKKFVSGQKVSDDESCWDVSALVQENQTLKRENEKLLYSLESHKNQISESSHNIGMLQGLLAMCD